MSQEPISPPTPTLVVTIYTTGPACMACRQTKRHLDKRGIRYTEVPVINGEYQEAFAELELTQAPVVCASVNGRESYWAGYRPDRIDALTKAPTSPQETL